MRLTDPGPGEILDRLTILAMKIVNGKQAGRNTDHWGAEWNALLGMAGGILHDGSEKGRHRYSHQLELGAINAALWQAEDEIRHIRLVDGKGNEDLTAAGEWGIRIQELNDRRAELITLINVNTGIDRPSDKV